jgi:hypothetical protein
VIEVWPDFYVEKKLLIEFLLPYAVTLFTAIALWLTPEP